MHTGDIEGAIKIDQFRNTGNIGYTRHRTKTNKTKQKIQHKKLKKMSTGTPPITGVNPGDSEG
jgi:hypothetical protein